LPCWSSRSESIAALPGAALHRGHPHCPGPKPHD